MSALSTAEFERLSLIAAGVDPSQIPSILDTATWRRLLIAGLLKNAANQAIAGSVDYYSQLPVTVGAPAVGATYLVRNSSGVYYINYKSSGVYIKITDTGSLTDWVYTPLSALGTLPDVTLTNLQSGQTITWDGSNWINSNPSSGSLNVQTYTPSSDVTWPTSSFFQITQFNLLANKKYFCQTNSICRLASGSVGRMYFFSNTNPLNYLSGVYTNYLGFSPFPAALNAIDITNNSFSDQRFVFDFIIQQPTNDIIKVAISDSTIKKGSQIVMTQID